MSCTCYIYRCSAKADMYLYLSEKDAFESLPEELLKNIGITEFAMELELTADKKLAREDPVKIMDNLKTQGFHLQMPSETSVEELLKRIAEEKQVNNSQKT
ncbi:MAG: YcgL domain-containing protein [Gammaproteobacteria bacterium]|nr:YcgL domain-containing protein [Gammaproteobacteria bacterium]